MPARPRLKSLTRGDIKTAINMLRQNRGRSLMTMLGIIIAIMAVVLIVGIGQGVQQQVQGQVKHLGKNLVMVRPGTQGSSLAGGLDSLTAPAVIGGLSGRDVAAIRSISTVDQVVPLSIVDGAVHSNDGGTFAGSVIGTNGALTNVLDQSIDYGGSLSGDNDSQGQAMIGADVAASLFNDNVPLGHSFTFRGKEFVVSGILHRFDSNPSLGDTNFNNAIFIRYDVAQKLTDDHAPIYEILAQIKPDASIDQAIQTINQKLRVVHGGAQTFSVLKQDQSLAATNKILEALTSFIIGAAGVTLLIGGIGIMNIMLVSVTERMHEIGIRKAVGATNHQILSQFMLEAAVLSLVGGLLGFALSVAAIYLLRIYSNLQPVMPWWPAVAAVFAALLIGIIFGSIPAIKAARKDPINALRNE